jgi:signal transduction histidine kinase
VGTLAYLAPEQTGRTARLVDQRADLYALGATLYELATGEPPFGTADALRLIHEHLARIPVPPSSLNPLVPTPLSHIIMHLLEKEPDNRYQTADGLVYDLERFLEVRGQLGTAELRVGEHDVPLRLRPPSRLVGRDAEVAQLRAALADALTGRCRGVLVGGAPGVGKTVLADELRPIVTGSDGWFVEGKFDAYRRDLEFDAVFQALRALGTLLLAQPEDELGRLRRRILASAGPNAGLLTATVPELAALLGVPPDPGDPLTAQTRAQRAMAAALREIARDRPLVMFLDDLQWAGRTPLGLIDVVLSEESIEGLLLVGAYREEGLDAAHPLAAPMVRWRGQAGVRHLRLDNLVPASTVAMVAEMLRAEETTVASLAEAIVSHTRGNPYEIVELLNALRRDEVLTVTPAGWWWDPAAVRGRLGESGAAELLTAGLAALPPESRSMMEAMACLGGRAELSVLQVAMAEPPDAVDQALAPTLDESLLVAEPGVRAAVRFRHDRIREGVLGSLDAPRLAALRLTLARRLATVPGLFAVAAEQYLPVTGALRESDERRQVAELLRRAARQATLTGDYALVNVLLTGALGLIEPDQTALLAQIHAGRHTALFSLGRLEEADEEYRTIAALPGTAQDRAEATAVQVASLTARNRFMEAKDLGFTALRELGIAVPAAGQFAAELDRRLDRLYQWLDHTNISDELARSSITDPTLLAAGRLLNHLLPPTYFGDSLAMHAWVSLEALRIWIEHGPGRTLVGSAADASFYCIEQRGDYAAAYRVVRRLLDVSEAKGYEPGVSDARIVYGIMCGWFEPLDNSIEQSRRAMEGLIAGGELDIAGVSYHQTVVALLDCAPTLHGCLAAVEEGLAFARRTGSEGTSQWLGCYQWLAGVLRGEDAAAAGDQMAVDRYAGNPLSVIHVHLTRAIAAAIFDDPVTLARHAAAALPLAPTRTGDTVTVMVQPLRAFGLARMARTADDDERPGLLAELDEMMRWLAERATDASDNFLHLLRLAEAERAWTLGDFRAAVLAFDAARSAVALRQRPWHRAMIAERAARFYLAHGMDQAGYDLLAEARQHYLAWGATAKVSQLDWAYPALRAQLGTAGEPAASPGHRATLSAGTVDLLGILSASQALSSETSIVGLHARVAQVLGAMTGATSVKLLLWSEDGQRWQWPAPATRDDDDRQHGMPESVLRVVQRTREPLMMADATADDRFARDPYFADVGCSSLLAVPIFSQGLLRAVLLLENRLIRSAFTTGRLDAVRLIAGQLAVSLDNAQLYADFRRIADEQAALRRVATLVALGAPPEQVLAAVAEEIGRLLRADTAVLVRYEQQDLEIAGQWNKIQLPAPAPTSIGTRLPLGGRNVSTLVHQTGQSARIDYEEGSGVIGQVAGHDCGLRSSVGVPVSVEGRLWGVMIVAFVVEDAPPADIEQRLASFTELVATAIANAQARAEVIASRARIVAAADRARQRIERDLHDGAQQRLVTLVLQLHGARKAVPSELGKVAADLQCIEAGLNDALGELREIARGIHPAILADGGLRPALQTLARRSPIPASVEVRSEERLPEQVEVSAYYVVAEALTNAVRHARASAIKIEAHTAGDILHLAIRDDGVGGAAFTGGTGLAGLKDRVEALGGRIVLDSPPGAGTSLRVELPLTACDAG